MKYSKDRATIDRLDVKILSALSSEGRMSRTQLSEKVFLSATPCLERMRKLEKHGIIKGYHAAVDIRSLTGVSFFRVEITFCRSNVNASHHFEQYITTLPQVIECESVLGNVDYIVKIAAHNIDEYQQIIDKIHKESGITFSHTTYPISKSVKESINTNIGQFYDAVMAETNN